MSSEFCSKLCQFETGLEVLNSDLYLLHKNVAKFFRMSRKTSGDGEDLELLATGSESEDSDKEEDYDDEGSNETDASEHARALDDHSFSKVMIQRRQDALSLQQKYMPNLFKRVEYVETSLDALIHDQALKGWLPMAPLSREAVSAICRDLISLPKQIVTCFAVYSRQDTELCIEGKTAEEAEFSIVSRTVMDKINQERT